MGHHKVFDHTLSSGARISEHLHHPLCVEDGRLKKIPAGPFQQLLKDGNMVAYKMILNMARILAQRLAASDDRLVS